MKYIIAFALGLVMGIATLAAGFYFNPFVGRSELSPLAISESGLNSLTYSTAPADSILYTNGGDSISQPFPEKASKLLEPSIEKSELLVTSLIDSRGEIAGIGIKMSTPAQSNRLIESKLIVDSAWHIYLPGRGSMAIYQQEDYWSYLRDIVIPAKLSSSDSWLGIWSRNMTVGPGALGTANVSGLSGEVAGLKSEAVESLTAKAYSSINGPASVIGSLSIILPEGGESSNDD